MTKKSRTVNLDKLILDAPIYKEFKKTFNDLQTYNNYGTSEFKYYEPKVISNGPNCFTAFCITFAIINVFAFATFLIATIIDYFVNPELYAGTEEESLIRGGEIYAIVLICWYTIMVTILLILTYYKKRNVDCYEKTCSGETIFWPCDILLGCLSGCV